MRVQGSFRAITETRLKLLASEPVEVKLKRPLLQTRRPVGALVAASLLAIITPFGSSQPEPPPTFSEPPRLAPPPRTILWLFAHPDDEVLTAAGALLRSAEHGNRNVVAFATDGGAVPLRDMPWLTTDEITAAREAEARAALAHADIVDVAFLRLPDGTLTLQGARAALADLMSAYPEAEAVRGHSPWDPYYGHLCGHPDHCAIGIALIEAARAGTIEDLVMYRIGHLFGRPLGGDGCTSLNATQHRIKQAMRGEYQLVRTAEGRYGIGGRSVPEAWEATEQAPECWDLPREDPLPPGPAW